jgi:hypothetical protein
MLMSQRTTIETCPNCHQTAAITWSGVDAFGHTQPVREDAVAIDCPNRCQIGRLGAHFPTRLNG